LIRIPEGHARACFQVELDALRHDVEAKWEEKLGKLRSRHADLKSLDVHALLVQAEKLAVGVERPLGYWGMGDMMGRLRWLVDRAELNLSHRLDKGTGIVPLGSKDGKVGFLPNREKISPFFLCVCGSAHRPNVPKPEP
jgi:hypothetical protein